MLSDRKKIEKTITGLAIALAVHVGLLMWAANFRVDAPRDLPEGNISLEIHDAVPSDAAAGTSANGPMDAASGAPSTLATGADAEAKPSAAPSVATQPDPATLAIPSRGEILATQSHSQPQTKPAPSRLGHLDPQSAKVRTAKAQTSTIRRNENPLKPTLHSKAASDGETAPLDVRDLHEEFLQERDDIAAAPIPEPYDKVKAPGPTPTASQPPSPQVEDKKAENAGPQPALSVAPLAPIAPALLASQSALSAQAGNLQSLVPGAPRPAAPTMGTEQNSLANGETKAPLANAGTGAPGAGVAVGSGTSGNGLASGGGGSGSGGGPAGPVREDLTLRPQAGNLTPLYPAQDRLQRNHGEVVFRYYVNKDGSVTSITVEKSTGHKSLDLEALKAMKKWKYYPGQEGWARKAFQFSLNGDVETMPARWGQASTAHQHAEVAQ